jgi:CBS domain-containing protein
VTVPQRVLDGYGVGGLMRTVADAMVAPVSIASTTTLQEAAAAMLDADAQAAVIVDGGRARGVLTADDVARALAEGRDPSETPVATIAESEPPLVREKDALAEAHRLMRVSQHRVVAVVGPRGEPVGLLVDPEA